MRLLAANGFEVTFIKRRKVLPVHRQVHQRCQLTPISAEERDARIAAYARGRAYAILRADEQIRSRFAGEWAEAVEIGVAAGLARFDAKGCCASRKAREPDRAGRYSFRPQCR